MAGAAGAVVGVVAAAARPPSVEGAVEAAAAEAVAGWAFAPRALLAAAVEWAAALEDPRGPSRPRRPNITGTQAGTRLCRHRRRAWTCSPSSTSCVCSGTRS